MTVSYSELRTYFRGCILRYYPDRSFEFLKKIIPLFHESIFIESPEIQLNTFRSSFSAIGYILTNQLQNNDQQFLEFQGKLFFYWVRSASIFDLATFEYLKKNCFSLKAVGEWVLSCPFKLP